MNDYEKKLHVLSQQIAFAKELLQNEWWSERLANRNIMGEFIDDQMRKIGELVWGELASQAATEES